LIIPLDGGKSKKPCSPGESLESFDEQLGSGSAFEVLLSMCKWSPQANQTPGSYRYEWGLAVASAVMDVQQKVLYQDLVAVS